MPIWQNLWSCQKCNQPSQLQVLKYPRVRLILEIESGAILYTRSPLNTTEFSIRKKKKKKKKTTVQDRDSGSSDNQNDQGSASSGWDKVFDESGTSQDEEVQEDASKIVLQN